MRKSLFIVVFVLTAAVMYGQGGHWLEVRGDDGRIWFVNHQIAENSGVRLVRELQSFYRESGFHDIRPTNAQLEALRRVRAIYRTRSGDVITGTIGRNRRDAAIFGNRMYGFIMQFTSETRYNLWFYVRP